MSPVPDGTGVVVTIRTRKGRRSSHSYRKNARRTHGAIIKLTAQSRYRPDLQQEALARSSAILRSQGDVVAKPRTNKRRDA